MIDTIKIKSHNFRLVVLLYQRRQTSLTPTAYDLQHQAKTPAKQ